MLTEISLNILDIVNNSISAGADFIVIEVRIHINKDILAIKIRDNGCGMSKQDLSKVEDPFFTTRSTRKVGLGIPFLKQAAQLTGGSFYMDSTPGRGTLVDVSFGLSHIDRMPLGDICSTIYTLILTNQNIDFLYIYECEGIEYELDTRKLREILGDIPFDTAEVAKFIRDYLDQNHKEVSKGQFF
ncbi:ATP-binding protein [Herbinix luporum]|mgnify:FL=1|jgi:hypothetical protein|uniref:histidine kinase n=1 Tax=Herbinix luporum TaxID=1679721 RepID=A0A0K8J8M3_9FIRM|nr:ATP-binding protein [Herbinix luporum]MDI9489097.1 ATP-binding protein [Bacillota bacterium]CUH93834.1 hypothetical protein SD1D_2322 [Herbinix luporum]HHT57609.1 ATP-binding protein [Herbinix luporum]